MDGFWGWALLMVFVIALTASLLAAVVRVVLLLERRVVDRRAKAPPASAPSVRAGAGRNAPARESVRMSPEQSRELDEEWSSLVDRLL